MSIAPLAAREALERYHTNPLQLIGRHVGDWGDVCPEDAQANEEALQFGTRILSAYLLMPPTDETETLTPAKVWLITEADRSATSSYCRRNIDPLFKSVRQKPLSTNQFYPISVDPNNEQEQSRTLFKYFSSTLKLIALPATLTVGRNSKLTDIHKPGRNHLMGKPAQAEPRP